MNSWLDTGIGSGINDQRKSIGSKSIFVLVFVNEFSQNRLLNQINLSMSGI